MWTNGSQALLVDLQIWDKNTISTERAPISACNYLVIIWLSLRMHMVDQVYTYLPSHRRGKYDEVNWSATTAIHEVNICQYRQLTGRYCTYFYLRPSLT